MRAAMVSGCLIAAAAAACSGSNDAADAAPPDAGRIGPGLGSVSAVADVTCPGGAPAGATCKMVTVAGCPGIEGEAIHATVAIVAPTGALRGTVVHLSGGGGEGYEQTGQAQYRAGGFRQVYVAWATDWEKTSSAGIKTAACRPATILAWVFDEPTLHGASRSLAFCGQGFSGGSGQLAYALATYGLGDTLDYVNELSGPPFARIDLGCDFSQPMTAQVCGATDTMRLPAAALNSWENTTTCGSATPSAADVARWLADSVSIGGTYAYPKTEVQFHDCTYQSTGVTAMAQIFYGQISAAEANDPSLSSYHCYAQSDGCQGEGLGTGSTTATNALLAGCTPRHL